MALTKLEENLNIIENLPDSPNLEPSELKRKFDEGSIKIKDFINETLIIEMDNIVTQIKKDINNKILEDNKKKYYIGKLVFDTKNVNPATYLGFGTWQLWGQGRVPVGIDSNDSDFNTAEKTGGEKTHKLTLAEIPSHTHTFKGNATSSAGAHTHTLNNHTHTYSKSSSKTGTTTLTVDQIPAHSHGYNAPKDTGSTNTYGLIYDDANGRWTAKGNATWNTGSIGGGKGHNHTITISSTNTGANNGNTSSNGAHTHTISGTNTNSGGDETHNNLQPYITCYIWKRTA